MDSSSIELPGSVIAGVEVSGDIVKVFFDPAYLIKTMTGSAERTRWHQRGALVFEGAELRVDLPPLPAECSGGDVGENIYTYRDMIPIPLESHGRAHCKLKVEGSDLAICIEAKSVRLVLEDSAKYIEHIKPTVGQ